MELKALEENSVEKTKKLKSKVLCSICGFLCASNKSRKSHMKAIHFKTKNHFCDICGEGFLRKESIRLHVFKHIPEELQERNFKCKSCPKSFKCQRSLILHIKGMHQKGKEVKCDCGKSFATKKRLHYHQKCVHQKEKYSKKCEICGKLLYDASKLREHIRIYHTEGGRGNFICSDCGKACDSVSRLNVHQKIHEGITYTCNEPDCGKDYQTKAALRNHKNNSHLKFSDFICEVENCGKAFVTDHKLQRHMKVKHVKHRVNCPVESCKFMVGRRDYMKNHLKKHTELDREELQKRLDSVKDMDLV